MLRSGIWVRLRLLGSLWLQRPPKWAVGLSVALVCVLAFALRCLHLLNDDHYFIVSPDSHYFHRMAELLVLDDTYFYPTHNQLLPISMLSGISYPLALIARGIAFASPVSPLDALELTSKFLPPILGVATVILIYFAVSRLYGRSVAILSALVWAVVPWGIFLQSAGYLDRDCLSILLITVGVFLYYFLTHARLRIGGRDFGWIIPAIAVLALEVLLYIEWGFLGPAILLTILLAYFLIQVFNKLVIRIAPALLAEENVIDWPLVVLRRVSTSMGTALQESAYKPIAAILGCNVAAIALRPDIFRSMYDLLSDVARGGAAGEATVGELAGMDLSDIQAWGLLVIPLAIGLYIGLRRRNQADLLVLAWFGIMFFAGLFSRRLFLYAAPAGCIMAGLGFVALFDLGGHRLSRLALEMSLVDSKAILRPLVAYLRVGCGFLVLLGTIAMSTVGAYSFASTPPVAADTEWHEALTWLRHNTADEVVVMTWWDYGYWILDVAHRTPVVDNGVHPDVTDSDIARVYATTDDSEAVSVMMQHGATYLVFSKLERRIFPNIVARLDSNIEYDDGNSAPEEIKDSLYSRSFRSDFQSDHGLQRVYTAGDIGDPSVVILTLQ